MTSWREVIETHDLMESSTSMAFWEAHLAKHPDVLYRILGDLYQVTAQSREMPDTLDELWAVITPSFSQLEFGEAVKALLGTQTITSLAVSSGHSHQNLSRWIRGEYPVVMLHDVSGSMRRIETIAKALRVHPSHFAEWRRLWAMELIDLAFESQPHLSVSFFKKFSRLEAVAVNGR